MKRSLVLAAAVAALLPFTAAAHKAWLVPSQTVLSGNAPWVTVDGAVSNNLFTPDHMPMRTDNLVITAPDGSQVDAKNATTGKFRSVFDIELAQAGTYRIATVNAGLMANWEEDGKRKRWRGNAATFATEVPKDAKDLVVSENIGRVETFVTNGNPNTTALKATGKGIELVAVTHPNDLFVGEQARFGVLVDGKPATGLEFEIIRGDTRFRNAQEEIKATTDAKGEFTVTFPQAGVYWLETTTEDKKTSVPQAKQRRLSYVVTLEVLPQ